ncbi:hypothetical protein ASJ79_17720 [Mycobacterium sp. NAZ190054]|nr:hypothetical protein ASJ79_17720 [Mycobacterium sp. NAZ190054]
MSLTLPGSIIGSWSNGCCAALNDGCSPAHSAVAWLRTIAVATPPGWTELTRMFFSASERAKWRITPMTPCLAAV